MEDQVREMRGGEVDRMELYPYQEKAVDDLRYALRRKVRAPLYVLSTGGGKTIIFSSIAKGAIARNKRVLILVHRKEIMAQTLSKLYEFGITAGQIAAGKPQTKDMVQVAMVQTIVRRLSYATSRPDLIIQDEAHHVTSDNSWGRVLKYWREVPCLGMTATPSRLDGRGLGETFSEIIMGPSMKWLVDNGYLSDPVIFHPPEEVLQNYHVKRGDFDTKEQQQTMTRRKIVGDVIDHYRKHMGGLPAICFCVSVEHTKLMAEQFRAAGYVAAPVYGDMADRDRDIALQGLANGSVQVVTSCDLISEGFDTPAVAGCILLRRTLSLGLYLQQCGRALRTAPGKTRAIILDHVGNYLLHGHILADREWSLDSQKRDPRKEKPPTTTTCPICFGVWPGSPQTCPDCGFKFSDVQREFKPLRQVAGELIEAIPGLAPQQADSMAAFLARTQQMEKGAKVKALWGKAYEMAGDGAPDARRRLDALRRALGYKAGFTRYVWQRVLGRRI